jgi:hypothetical protein
MCCASRSTPLGRSTLKDVVQWAVDGWVSVDLSLKDVLPTPSPDVGCTLQGNLAMRTLVVGGGSGWAELITLLGFFITGRLQLATAL